MSEMMAIITYANYKGSSGDSHEMQKTLKTRGY